MQVRKAEGRGIVVLGMHRSGTSSVTGLLGRCGVWLGREADMTGASAQNPKGFFERRDMRNICDALLHSAGADWWRIADFAVDRIPERTLAEEGEQFSLLTAQMATHGVWAVKEPRLCLLFPVLRQYLDNPVCLVVHRDPLAVAKSLRVRNGFSIFHGLALWEVYMRAALAASEGRPRIVMSYDSLVAAPAAEAETLVTRLRGFGMEGLVADPEVCEFISPSLRHEVRTEEEADAFLAPAQQRLWAALVSSEGLVAEAAKPLSSRTTLVLQDFELQQKRQDEVAARNRALSASQEARAKV